MSVFTVFKARLKNNTDAPASSEHFFPTMVLSFLSSSGGCHSTSDHSGRLLRRKSRFDDSWGGSFKKIPKDNQCHKGNNFPELMFLFLETMSETSLSCFLALVNH